MRKRRTIRDYILQIYYFITLKIVYPAQYKIHARKPVVKGKVILLEPRFPETTDSLRQIKNALIKKGGYEILEMQLGIERLHLNEQNKRIMAFLREFATAEYVFTTDSNKTVGGFEKRPETKVVQVWHACGAFKRFGFSTAKLTFGGTSFKQKFYPLHRNYDVVTVSSPEVVWAYEEAMMLEGQNKVKPWGISRTDVFFNEEFLNSAREAVRNAVPEAAGKKVILYAPTFRGKVLYAESPNEMDLLKMKEALGEEYVLLIKHHPFVKNRPVIDESCSDFAFDVTDALEIDQLLCASDICISDYSSLIFEYSLFERPMLFFAYDLDEYFDYRGFYYDYDEMTPGPIVKDTEEIIDYIVNIDTRFDLQEVQAFRDKFMSSCDGHVTERILENICK
ncbi:MAG: CDP-glycerol glycerophosphotransferase family protein [Clostridia bacterium]|nr:CDP-glycerol glycerophosphotransferase family protein [Clostridia bacterium]